MESQTAALGWEEYAAAHKQVKVAVLSPFLFYKVSV
jgi:hypothetical protein